MPGPQWRGHSNTCCASPRLRAPRRILHLTGAAICQAPDRMPLFTAAAALAELTESRGTPALPYRKSESGGSHSQGANTACHAKSNTPFVRPLSPPGGTRRRSGCRPRGRAGESPRIPASPGMPLKRLASLSSSGVLASICQRMRFAHWWAGPQTSRTSRCAPASLMVRAKRYIPVWRLSLSRRFSISSVPSRAARNGARGRRVELVQRLRSSSSLQHHHPATLQIRLPLGEAIGPVLRVSR